MTGGETYADYLSSADWQRVRETILQRDSHRCIRCGSNQNLQIHHRTYKRVRHEWARDLMTLCARCHMAEHGLCEWPTKAARRWWKRNRKRLKYKPDKDDKYQAEWDLKIRREYKKRRSRDAALERWRDENPVRRRSRPSDTVNRDAEFGSAESTERDGPPPTLLCDPLREGGRQMVAAGSASCATIGQLKRHAAGRISERPHRAIKPLRSNVASAK